MVAAENACSQDTECSVILTHDEGHSRFQTCQGSAIALANGGIAPERFSVWIKGKHIAFPKQIFMLNIISYAPNFEIIFCN